jgi:hypothetical protein
MALSYCYPPPVPDCKVPPAFHEPCNRISLDTYQADKEWFVKLDAPYPEEQELTVEEQFQLLADEWSQATMHISSASDLINDSRYQKIIGIGWDVVPYLLIDLQKNKRFWFPALAAITGVRPFDKGDSSNPRRMTEAWVKWGKRKGLI